MAKGFKHTFSWNGPAQTVVLTGTFDNWSSSITLEKVSENRHERTITFPYGQKVEYKFVVDGEWKIKEDDPTEMDGGNQNNVLNVPAAPAEEESTTGAAAAAGASPIREAESSINKVVSGFAGAAGAAIQTIIGVDPINGQPRDIDDRAGAATKEVPAEPVHTPAVPAAVADENKSQPTVPSNEAITRAADSPTVPAQSAPAAATTGAKEEKSDAPAIAAAGAAVGAVGAGAAVAAQKAYGATKDTAASATSGLRAESGGAAPTSDFGKSTMQALGLNDSSSKAATTQQQTQGVESIKPAAATTTSPVVLNDSKLNTTSSSAPSGSTMSPAATTNGSGKVGAPDATITPIAPKDAPVTSSAPNTNTSTNATSTSKSTSKPSQPAVQQTTTNTAAVPKAVAATPVPAAKHAPATPAKDAHLTGSPALSQSSGKESKTAAAAPAPQQTTAKYLEGKGQPGAPSDAAAAGSDSGAAKKTKERKPSFFQKLKKALK